MLLAARHPLPPISRLLVLVPDGPLPTLELAQRLWHLAAPGGWAVLLLGLVAAPERELPLRRALALLGAHTRHDPVAVSTRVVVGPDWLAALRALWRPGDLVVCFNGQTVRPHGRSQAALPSAVQAALDAPVYVLGDSPPAPWPRQAHAARGWLWTLCSLAVIAGFFVLQAWIQQAAPAVAGPLLGLSVLFEFGVLGLLHHVFMRE
jgi:hypothetical protein